MNNRFSSAEREHLRKGPFPNRVDPWAETARYFQAIHSGMIGDLLTELQDPLFDLGYVAGKESSIQIAGGRAEPDINVRRDDSPRDGIVRLDYELAATEILAEPGIMVQDKADLESLHIREAQSGDLVTIVEIVSPGNKAKDNLISAYQIRRRQFIEERGVNIVEIDPTRSVKRLLANSLTADSPYHIAIFLPGEYPRVIGIDFEMPLARVALPLRGEVIPMELQNAYQNVYRQATISWHIQHERQYNSDDLPFSSLLTDKQHQTSKEAVKTWQEKLMCLREKT